MTTSVHPGMIDSGSLPPEDDERLFSDEDIPQAEPQFTFMDEKLAAFMRSANTGKAKDYEKKLGGVINAAMQAAISNPGTVADAAALIAYGDKFCKTGGALAAEDPRFAKVVDFIAVPANPYVMFAMTAIPLALQLLRNHEDQVSGAGKKFKQKRAERKSNSKPPRVLTYITIPGLNRKIRVPFRVKWSLKLLTGTSVEPSALASEVFSNPNVQRELAKRGIKIG